MTSDQLQMVQHLGCDSEIRDKQPEGIARASMTNEEISPDIAYT